MLFSADVNDGDSYEGSFSLVVKEGKVYIKTSVSSEKANGKYIISINKEN